MIVELNKAIEYIKSEQASCVLMKDGIIIDKTSGIGVKPILGFLENDMLKGMQVADKVIGKAAAMLLALGGVTYVHGEIMSKSGQDYLQKNKIAHSHGLLVENIINRDGTDLCPLEKSVVAIDDLQEGYRAIKDMIAILMSKK